MSGVKFFQSIMGRQFYDCSVPKLVSGIDRLATAAEHLVDQRSYNIPTILKRPLKSYQLEEIATNTRGVACVIAVDLGDLGWF